jgi:hypothetical protein
MKKFYLHDGKDQHGPYDLNELKEKAITTETPIWFKGLEDWKPAKEIAELKDLIGDTPPAFNIPTPPKFNQQHLVLDYSLEREKSPRRQRLFIGGSALIAIIFAIVYFINNNNSQAATGTSATPTASEPVTKDDPDKIRLKELEEKERKRQVENEALSMKNMEYRNNWSKYVEFKTNSYRVDSWGGIYNLEIYATNNTDRIIDEVIVTVDYYKENNELYTTKQVSITNIQPNSYASTKVPDTNRGTRIETRISRITSSSLHFCYNSDYDGKVSEGISGNENDPWFCK